MRAKFEHTTIIDVPRDELLYMLTPKGDQVWLPDWRPNFVEPESGETKEGMLWTMKVGGRESYWTCTVWDPTAGKARYLQVKPENRFTYADTTCVAVNKQRTQVFWLYEHYTIGRKGDEFIRAITPAKFVSMIEDWSKWVAAAYNKGLHRENDGPV